MRWKRKVQNVGWKRKESWRFITPRRWSAEIIIVGAVLLMAERWGERM